MSKTPESMENATAAQASDVDVPDENGEAASILAIDQVLQDAAGADLVDGLQTELAAANDRLLRSQAELENYRKRVQRDMEQQRRYAAVPVMSDLLLVVDNIQRAVEAAEKNDGTGGLLEGIKLVATQLNGLLEQHHCTPIPAVGTQFDPHLHEALGQLPSDEHPANTVMVETRSGYQIHDRVVRPSQVFISAGPAVRAPDDKEDTE